MGFQSDNIEATKSLKHTIKRDINGVVQFKNLAKVQNASPYLSGVFLEAQDSASNTATGNALNVAEGWNFFGPPNVTMNAFFGISGSSMAGIASAEVTAFLNGVAKNTAQDSTPFDVASTSQFTLATDGVGAANAASNQTAPNTLKIRGKMKISLTTGTITYGFGSALASDNGRGQINDKTTVRL